MPIPETIAHVYQNALTTLFTTTTSISICYWLGDSAQRWRTPDQRYWLGDSAQRWRVARNGAPQAGRRRGRWAAAGGVPLPDSFPSPPISPVPSGGPHHSAANAVSKRNPLPVLTIPTIPQNFAGKILRNPQPHPIAHPRKKNGPRESPGTVGGLQGTTCDLRLTMHDFANRKS